MDVKYTCITCRVAFLEYDLQRLHYKTDWHRYNLKRKVAELPPVTVEEFNLLVLLQREKDNIENTSTSYHCATCRKYFNSENAYNNHLNSKRHKFSVIENNIEDNGPKKTTNNTTSQVVSIPKSETNKRKIVTDDPATVGEDSDEYEEGDSDEWEDVSEDDPILNIEHCLFCSHHSASMLKNLKHMSVVHSFFIPDMEYVVDITGLMVFLREKVTNGYMCLWCNEKGRSFYSKEAAQQHMLDKGHCKMFHEGETLAEYSYFYDYSASYPEVSLEVDEACLPVAIDDTGLQLKLPSGATIGHRSLRRYYRQNLNPNRSLNPHKKLYRDLARYRGVGWTVTQQEQVVRRARDLQFMKRVLSKYITKLGTKANKLQKHFRPQVNF